MIVSVSMPEATPNEFEGNETESLVDLETLRDIYNYHYTLLVISYFVLYLRITYVYLHALWTHGRMMMMRGVAGSYRYICWYLPIRETIAKERGLKEECEQRTYSGQSLVRTRAHSIDTS